MQIQLFLKEPTTGVKREPIFNLPVAMGRDFAGMPVQLNGRAVSRFVLNSGEISRYHLLIEEDNGSIIIVDQNSRNGVFINGHYAIMRCTR